ncbi:NAD-dependent epimerase/dehydratase family protein [Pedobacter panaciterrae]
MKADKKTALVVGANGIIGTNLINYLEELGTWDIIGLSRRGDKHQENPIYSC